MTAPAAAVGTLAETPLAHALVYARNRRLSGRLELTGVDQKRASVTLWRGRIVTVEISPPLSEAFLATILYEYRLIDTPTLESSLVEMMRTKRLHGEVLVERQAITSVQRDEALVEQMHRKVHHLFGWAPSTRYAFYDAPIEIGPSVVTVDPTGPIWRGIRDYPPSAFVAETIRRVGPNALHSLAGGSARLPPDEMALAEALALRPMTIAEMKAATSLPPDRVELLVYLLVIAKCVEAVSGVRTHPSTGALPATMASGPVATVRASLRGLPVQSIRPSGIVPTVPPSSPRISIPPARSSTPSRFPAQRSMTPSSQPAVAVAAPVALSPTELGPAAIIARAATVETDDYFHVLGVPENATAEAARAAYIRLAKSWHPDRTPTELYMVRNEIAKIFSQMSRAQQTLCDPDARRGYLAAKKAKTTPKERPRTEVMREIEHATRKGDAEFVIQLCQELIDNNSDDAEAMARQAWASVGFGEADEAALRAALPRLEKAVNINRTDDQAVYHRGLVHKRLNNVPAAFRDFARAIQLNPKHVDAEREVRIYAMRARKGSGEHKLGLPLLDKTGKK